LGAIRRQMWGGLVGLVLVLATLVLIVSAVMPHVPLLRIHERGEKRTAEAIVAIQCTVLWANGYRLPSCAKVNVALSQVTGQP